MTNFADRLFEAAHRKGASVCAGIDPRTNLIPDEFYARHDSTPDGIIAAVRDFCVEVIDLVAEFVPAIKPQAAFFEALGPSGFQALADVCAHARQHDLLVINDVKRGDIGSTSEAYAQSLFGETKIRDVIMPSLQSDAATINPYLGSDGVLPFKDRALANEGGLFILARTSNLSSSEFQLLDNNGTLVVDRVAKLIHQWGADCIGKAGYSAIGAVVGATHPDDAKRLRTLLPHTPFLVPGWGAQGGKAEAIKACFDTNGRGAIVNSSRGVMHAYAVGDLKHYGMERWKDAVREAAKNLRDDVSGLVGEPKAF